MKLAIITCHFNPAGFRTPRRNLMRFLRQLSVTAIDPFVAELAYGQQPFFLPPVANVLHFRTEFDNIMWHKENLLNLVERVVPMEFDALAWIDADVWFEDPGWYDRAAEALQKFAVVQLFDQIVLTDQDGKTIRRRPSAAADGFVNLNVNTPGFAWAARRSLWQTAGGLYERAIIGGGDLVNASTWLPTQNSISPKLNYGGLAPQIARLRSWCAREGGCNVVPGTLWHEWHGDREKRRYRERHQWIEMLNVEAQLTKRSDGLLEFDASVPDHLKQTIREYFHSRYEDGDPVMNPSQAPEQEVTASTL